MEIFSWLVPYIGHVGEVSTLAVQHDGCLLASAGISGGVALPCEIRVWKTSSAKCYKVTTPPYSSGSHGYTIGLAVHKYWYTCTCVFLCNGLV